MYSKVKIRLSAMVLVLACFAFIPALGFATLYGIKDSKGVFVPKVSVEMGKKEILITKVDPHEKFKSFALILNRKSPALIRNIGSVNIEWIASDNRPTKPVPFAGATYDPNKLKFEESVTRSIGMKLVDKSARNLFTGKQFSDLFSMFLDQQPLVAKEGATESEGAVKLGAGRDISINVDKTSITFNENNIKKGEIINIDNRSGLDQTLGVEIPEKDLLYTQIVRKPEQTKVPREIWGKFKVTADSGIFVVLIPDPDPARLANLNGKEVVVRIYQGDKVRESIRVPIKTVTESIAAGSGHGASTSVHEQDLKPLAKPTAPSSSQVTEAQQVPAPAASMEKAGPSRELENRGATTAVGIWILQIFNLVALIALALYGAFFVLPKVQVLEARMSKSEMFLHGAREAIREELDKTKEEILNECKTENPPNESQQG
ncbi:MAG: hypothetical protein M0T73_12970 [Deltaproteobacteria bacterium]|nr:hypothetical protein [Deltaproteobacteria bacterium]